MAEVFGPEGTLCAGVAYTFEALEAEECLLINWVVIGAPAAVSFDDVVFSAPQSLITQITVPIEGEYQFSFECCSEA